MREVFLRAYNQIKEAWSKLQQNQKMMIAAAVGVVLITAMGVAFWSIRPSYSTLFSNLSTEDAGNIVQKLKDEGVSYQVSGSTIEVPEGEVYDLRLKLAAQGLPQSGGVGYELFDKAGFGQTEFSQNVNLKRALEGELGRTISELEGVERARVHIVLPKESVFSEKEKDATASILLTLKPGAELDQEPVQGIVNLVSKSVEGLKQKNVSVVDANGNILTSDRNDTAKLTMDQLDLKKAYESQLQEGLERMLQAVVGPSKSTVKVSADMDFSRAETKKTTFDSNPVPRSEQTAQEKFDGGGTGGQGVAGITSNIPGVNFNSNTNNTNNKYSKNTQTINNEIGEQIENRITPPGDIKRLSVAILLDSSVAELPEVSKLNQAAMAAAGIDLSRGDQLFVQSLPFDKTVEQEAAKEASAEKQSELYQLLAKILALVLLVGLVVYIAKRMLDSQQPLPFATEFSLPAPSFDELIPTVAQMPVVPKIDKEEARRQQIYSHVENMAKEKPEEVARLLEKWLSAD